MIRIAVVEDQNDDFNILKKYVEQYGKENHILLEIVHFSNGLNFLDEYTADFDVVFMDIEMPHMDGLETAKKLREIDSKVALIFVTNMIQYAINGYEVDAIDFMVKPVTYYNFSKKLKKAFVYSEHNKEKHMLFRKDEADVIVSVGSIYYIEKDKNYAVYHTSKGDFRMRETLTEIEKEFVPYEFIKCSASCLVNMAYISEIRKDCLVVNGTYIPIARRLKKDILLKIAQYFGGFNA